MIDLHTASPRGHGAVLAVRPDTNDAATIHSTFWQPGFAKLEDEYGLADLHIDGWALDIGAHIGSVALAIALDNPDARILAVEAVPENVEMLRENVRRIGTEDRITVIDAAAAAEGDKTAYIRYGPYDMPGIPPEHAMQSRFIGNLYRDHGPRGLEKVVPCVSLSGLLDGIERVQFMKIDCEGCEWGFLASPAVEKVDLIVGEYHDHGAHALRGLLHLTHRVEILHEDGGFGLFRASRLDAGGRALDRSPSLATS